MSRRNRFVVPLILALIKFLLPFLLQDPSYQLHRDEYLYLAEGHHMAWGFMEVPPVLSVFSKLTIWMGSSFFWVKFWPSLFGALTLLVICEMVYEMGGKLFAQLMAALAVMTAVYMRVNFLFQPTSIEILLWGTMALVLVKYINHNRAPRYLYLLGILMGLSFLTKYSVLFYATGIFVGIVFTSNRKLLLQKHIYLAICIALLLALPNIFWQYQHSWPVITHMKELRETQLQYINPFDFLKEQLLMHLPSVYYMLGGIGWLFFSHRAKPYRILAWGYLTVILILLATSGKSYYALGAYPAVFAAGGIWLEEVTAKRLHWIRYPSLAITLALAVYFVPIVLPISKPDTLAAYYERHDFAKKGVLKWEDLKIHPLPQDFADMLGWKEMANKVSKVYAGLPDSIKSATLIHCRNYGQAGAVTYYGTGLPQVNTDNASFLFWMPDRYSVKNILLVAERMPKKDDTVFQMFEKVTVVDSVTNQLSREYGTKIILYENGYAGLNHAIEKSVREQKDEFRR